MERGEREIVCSATRPPRCLRTGRTEQNRTGLESRLLIIFIKSSGCMVLLVCLKYRLHWCYHLTGFLLVSWSALVSEDAALSRRVLFSRVMDEHGFRENGAVRGGGQLKYYNKGSPSNCRSNLWKYFRSCIRICRRISLSRALISGCMHASRA